MIRLVIIEDEDLIRLGIKTAINQEKNMEVLGECATGYEGIKLVELLQPDIVLIDIGLPDISGLDVIYEIKSKSDIKIIVFTYYSSQEVINLALQNGADSYILKNNPLDLIKQAITSTYQNIPFIDPTIARRFFETYPRRGHKIKGKKYKDLPTQTEIQILKLIACGYTNKQITEQLFITLSTVKSHTSSLFSKLGVGDRVNAIIKGREFGYLESETLRVS
jgi:DNA-binding NarL/FixJ family response regulator